jgi:hypothetical protein
MNSANGSLSATTCSLIFTTISILPAINAASLLQQNGQRTSRSMEQVPNWVPGTNVRPEYRWECISQPPFQLGIRSSVRERTIKFSVTKERKSFARNRPSMLGTRRSQVDFLQPYALILVRATQTEKNRAEAQIWSRQLVDLRERGERPPESAEIRCCLSNRIARQRASHL